MATHFRVIFHTGSGSNKSLLQHLNAIKGLKMLTTVMPVSESARMFQGMGVHEAVVDGASQTAGFYPILGTGPFSGEARLHEWWEQIVYIVSPREHDEQPHIFRRKDIILMAVNKEGGAHVDAYVSEDYEKLATGAPGHVHYDGLPTTEMNIIAAHFVCLRQIGYEVLNSRALLDLLRVSSDYRN